MTQPLSLQLLRSLQETTDLALDFIEHEIGANMFQHRWHLLKQAEDPVIRVQNWLQKIGAKGDPREIVRIIDEYADSGTKFLTPFTSPIPPNK